MPERSRKEGYFLVNVAAPDIPPANGNAGHEAEEELCGSPKSRTSVS
jgi:hypothetical protein